jgi:CRP/FNR family cyclic AMP-dependent transcriptional regulator
MIDLWHLEKIDWLRDQPEAIGTRLRKAAEIKHYLRGTMIFEPRVDPAHVYLLESGLIRIYRESRQAEEFTFGFVRPGEVFGECAAFLNSQRESYAVAVEPSDVMIIERQAFSAAIRESPSMFFSVANQIEGRFKDIESRIEDLVFRDARSRLANIILQLGEEFGFQEGGHIVVPLRLTHAELATLIGTSRPTVSIFLGEFEDENIVTRSEGRLIVLDREKLKALIRN